MKIKNNWSEIYEDWRGSGQSINQLCKQRGISSSGFYHWMHKNGHSDQIKGQRPSRKSSSKFVRLSPSLGLPIPVVIELPNKVKITLAGLDQSLVQFLAGIG